MGTEANLRTIDDVHDIPLDEGCEAIRQRTRSKVHAGHSSNTVNSGRPSLNSSRVALHLGVSTSSDI